jgi:hypothetical protein
MPYTPIDVNESMANQGCKLFKIVFIVQFLNSWDFPEREIKGTITGCYTINNPDSLR